MKTYLFTLSLSILIALGITPVIIVWAKKHKIVDCPNARKIHTEPIARLGGIPIFLATIVSLLPVLTLQNKIGQQFRESFVDICILLIGATMMFLVGLWDDFKELRVRSKLAVQLIASLLVCSAGIYIKHITIRDMFSIDLGWLGVLLTVFWIVGITNAINLIDGLDGLAGGISAIACGIIAFMSMWQNNLLLSTVMLALLGGLIGFMCFNFYPAKIFMGDCGSLFLGFIISSTSVLTAAKAEALVGLGLPILMLGIPIFDTIFSILRRILERRGIMSPDRDHFHHKLLDMGWRQYHVAIIAYIITLVISGFGLFMILTRGTSSILILISCLLLLLLVFRLVGAVQLDEVLSKVKHRYLLFKEQSEEKKHFEKTQLMLRRASNIEQWWYCMCKAAQALDFAQMSLVLKQNSRDVRALSWQNKDTKLTLSNQIDCVQMQLPVKVPNTFNACQMKIVILTRKSLESVGRRAALFGRLTEENTLVSHMEKSVEKSKVWKFNIDNKICSVG